jgi:hypothetical protein
VTEAERTIIILATDFVALLLAGAMGWWMHWREMKPGASIPSGPPPFPWFLTRPGFWSVRILAVGLLVWPLSGLIRPWFCATPRATETLMDSFTTHALAHRQIEQENARRLTAPLTGGDIEVLAVSEVSAGPPLCWLPEGTLFCPPIESPAKANRPGNNRREIILSLALPKTPGGIPILPFSLLVNDKEIASTDVRWCPNQTGSLGFILFTPPQEASEFDLQVGVPAEDWQDTDAGWEWTGQLPRHTERILRRSGQNISLSLAAVKDKSGHLEVTWANARFPNSWLGRLAAYDDAGNMHEPIVPNYLSLRDQATPYAWIGQYNEFKVNSSTHIKEFRFQYLHFRWTTFRHISLRPGKTTRVDLLNPLTPTKTNLLAPAQKAKAITLETTRSMFSLPVRNGNLELLANVNLRPKETERTLNVLSTE